MNTDRRPATRAPRRRRLLIAVAVGVALAGATSFLVYPILMTGRDAAMVHLIEPRTWMADEAAALEVDPGRALPITGIALQAGPIREVRLDGRRLGLSPALDGAAMEFSGYLNADEIRGDAIAIEVLGPGTARTIRRFPVRVRPGDGPGPTFPDVDRGERSQRWAVVIGADEFADSRIPANPAAGVGARAIAAFLRSPAAGLGGLPETHIRLLTGEQATGRALRSGLKTFLRAATPGDLVVIYVAGRVVRDPHRLDRLYLLAWDTDPADIPATAVDLGYVREAIREVYGHTRLVIADLGGPPGDAGGPGAFLRDSAMARQGGLAVLTRGHAADDGPLAHLLLAGLQGAADFDRDGHVRLGEALRFAGQAGTALVARTSYDASWPLARIPVRTALTAPAPPPDR